MGFVRRHEAFFIGEKMNSDAQMIALTWEFREKKANFLPWLYKDAIESGAIKVVIPPDIFQTGTMRKIYRMHCKSKLPFKGIWHKIFLWKIKLKKEQNYIFVINDQHPMLYSTEFLKFLKKTYNAKIVLNIKNMIVNKRYPIIFDNCEFEQYKGFFDLIITDEKKDADLFGLNYCPDPFSNMYLEEFKITSDLCFCGADKGRIELLKQIANDAIDRKIKIDFIMPEHNPYRLNGIQCDKWMSYNDVVRQDLMSNCILELMQPGQKSFTLRFEEAVCCNKKLLTNNQEVLKSKFYNPRYVQIFNNPRDIDWEFVKKKEKVEYGYNGEFSAIRFFECIREELKKMEAYHD